MAVTQALRHSIFKRDNQTCQSCGATAPEVKIVVDHVTPKALGGTDQADNLQTLCQPCNAGKGATPPGAPLVAAVKADALRHAEMLRMAYAVLVERIGRREEYEEEFLSAYAHTYVPADWQRSLARFFMMGVPVELIADGARIAGAKRGLGTDARFKYFCGIIWNQVQAVDAVTATKATLEGHFHTDESLDEFGAVSWKLGWELGYKSGLAAAPREDWPPTAQEIEMNGAGDRSHVFGADLDEQIINAYEEGKDVGTRTAWYVVEGMEASIQRHYEECGYVS